MVKMNRRKRKGRWGWYQSRVNSLIHCHILTDLWIRFNCQKKNKLKLAKALSDMVVYCKSVHFRSFEDAKNNQSFYEISSFKEGDAIKLAEESGKQDLETFFLIGASGNSHIFDCTRNGRFWLSEVGKCFVKLDTTSPVVILRLGLWHLSPVQNDAPCCVMTIRNLV